MKTADLRVCSHRTSALTFGRNTLISVTLFTLRINASVKNQMDSTLIQSVNATLTLMPTLSLRANTHYIIVKIKASLPFPCSGQLKEPWVYSMCDTAFFCAM